MPNMYIATLGPLGSQKQLLRSSKDFSNLEI